jgi:hypothetical protein
LTDPKQWRYSRHHVQSGTSVFRVPRNQDSFDKVQSLLNPFPPDLMAAHEVSKRMNNPKYDAPDCSAPVVG